MNNVTELNNEKYDVNDFSNELLQRIYELYQHKPFVFQAMYAENLMGELREVKCEYDVSTDILIITPQKTKLPFGYESQFSLKGVYEKISENIHTGRIVFPDSFGKLIIEENYSFNIISALFKCKVLSNRTTVKLYKDISEYDLSIVDDDYSFIYEGFDIKQVNVKELNFAGTVESEIFEDYVSVSFKAGDIKIDKEDAFWKEESIFIVYTFRKRGIRSTLNLCDMNIGYDEINRIIFT